jgi:hypothetical protein
MSLDKEPHMLTAPENLTLSSILQSFTGNGDISIYNGWGISISFFQKIDTSMKFHDNFTKTLRNKCTKF